MAETAEFVMLVFSTVAVALGLLLSLGFAIGAIALALTCAAHYIRRKP